MREANKIDELFKKGLADYQSELPSDKTKDIIFGRLTYFQYLKWIIGSVLVVFISASIWAVINLIPKAVNEKPDTISASDTYVKKQISEEMQTDVNKTKNTIPFQLKNNNLKPNSRINNKINIQNIKNIEKNITTSISTSSSIDYKSEIKPQPQITEISVPSSSLTIEESLEAVIIANADNVTEKETNVNIKTDAEKTINESDTTYNKIDKLTDFDGIIKKTYKRPFLSRFEILMSGNFYYVDKKLSAGSEFTNLVKIREKGESPVLTFSPALEIRYNFNNVFIQSGIQYQKYGEKLDFSTSEIIKELNDKWLIHDSLYYVRDSINPPGSWHLDTIWFHIIDTSYRTKKYTFKKTNSYNYFEIPLLIGKQIQLNRFSIEVSTGISFGFLLKSDAEILATDQKTAILLKDEKSPYLNTLMLNYLFRLSLRYQLNERWSIFVSPNIKYNIGNIFNENQYPIKQNYLLYGIGSGLIYKL